MRAAPNTEQHLRSFCRARYDATRGSPPKLQFYDIAATAARRFIASGARPGEHTLRNNQSTHSAARAPRSATACLFCATRCSGERAFTSTVRLLTRRIKWGTVARPLGHGAHALTRLRILTPAAKNALQPYVHMGSDLVSNPPSMDDTHLRQVMVEHYAEFKVARSKYAGHLVRELENRCHVSLNATRVRHESSYGAAACASLGQAD